MSDMARFNAKVAIDHVSGCWQWIASKTPAGYGKFYAQGKLRLAHRWSYEALVGPIPTGLFIDHLCRNRACVNPAHMEPVTCKENLLRGNGWAGRNARVTHCKYGHEYTEENIYRTPKNPTMRFCRECRRRVPVRQADLPTGAVAGAA